MYSLLILFLTLLLSACQTQQQKEDAELMRTIDPGARQVLMEEEAQTPTQEEDIIPAPSDMTRMY